MGEVYRARDTRLERDVAIKVLLSSAALDPELLRRFEQEARAAGALNHPNVLIIYDVGTDNGTPYLVSELLEGEGLDKSLEGGPLPPRKAVDYAMQVARGLAAAHDRGIVHRDLKPGNLFVTRDGLVKILDFGLAKLKQAPTGFSSNSEARTVSVGTHTEPGVVLGTVGYMSPEQVRGREVDGRSDLFSLGAVVYEMLTGQRAFHRDSSIETLSAILKEEPADIGSLSPHVPQSIERVVLRCLEKKPDERFQSARDLAFALEAVGSGAQEIQPVKPKPQARHAPLWVTPVLLVAGGLAGAGLTRWMLGPGTTELPQLHYLTYSGHDSAPAASPDGRTIAFSSDRDGRSRIWLKQLSGGEQAITEGPDNLPRFSPDGSLILFARQEKGRTSLYRMSTIGGDPRKMVDDAAEGDWSPDGRQVAFVRTKGDAGILGVVAADGSGAREIARFENLRATHPRWCPDGKIVALTPEMWRTVSHDVLLVDVPRKQVRTLRSALGGFFISSVAWSGKGDEVMYVQAESAAGTVVGSTARLIAQNVSSGKHRVVAYSPTSSNVLDILGPGRVVFDSRSPREGLQEISLKGNSAASRWLTKGNVSDRQPAYSPDGEWIIFSSNRSGNLDLWEISTKTGSVRRITEDMAEDWDPTFTPDGHIVWSSNRSGHFEIWIAEADGSGARQITHDEGDAENPSVTADAQWVVYTSVNPAKMGIWKIHPDGSGAARILNRPALMSEVSPDGRYAAYVSNAFGLDRLAIRVVRTLDGRDVPFEIMVPVRNRLRGRLGRSRWLPGGRAVAYVGQDNEGRDGIYQQDFIPGQDTTHTRKDLAGFDADNASESFAISPDGTHMILAQWEQISGLVLAERLPGVSPARPR